MARSTYSSDELGKEVRAPSGYYQPLEEGSLEYEGRRVLYTLGTACVEASCCGKGSWTYLRVEGYVVDLRTPANEAGSGSGVPPDGVASRTVEVDTVETDGDRAAIAEIVRQKYPEARIEFR